MEVHILGSRGVPANYGGFETFAEHLGAGLVDAGHRVVVYCPSYQEYRDPVYRGILLRFVFCADDLFKNRVLRASANLLYDIFSLIIASFSAADVIYMLGYASGPFLFIPRLVGKTLVVNPDGLEWKSKRWGLLPRTWLFLCEWISVHSANALVADALPIEQHFKDKFSANVACVPYGAEVPPESATDANTKDYYFIIARMVPETSIPLMVRGYRLANTARRLIIVGPIADQTFFDAEIAPLVDGDMVQYLGPIYDRARVTELRSEALALLHGHASDGTNPSLLESMACGSAVIAVRTKSNSAVLGENLDFYFRDEAEIAACIERLETMTSSDISRMAKVNRNVIIERYGWVACVERHVDIFDHARARRALPA